MKTVEDFFKEIEGSETLQNDLKGIKGKNALSDFLKKNNVGTTAEEFVKAFKAKKEAEGEITDDAAENVAGGAVYLWWPDDSDWDYGVSEHAD